MPALTSKHTTLPSSFYKRDTAAVARELLGKLLSVKNSHVWRSGVIVEDEAYLRNDPACHAYNGQTKRNRSMFGHPGTAYVYPIHQVCCFNVVTVPGEAVLIRAVEPVENVESSTDGPGRLCRALGISRDKHDGQLIGETVKISSIDYPKFQTRVSSRIGISKAAELPLRFYVRDNPYLSRPAFSARKSGMR